MTFGLLQTTGAPSATNQLNGFTQILPQADGTLAPIIGAVPTLQQGSSYSGNGSRVIYVSSSSGNDSTGTGTQAAPFASLSKGLSYLRNGYADQLLLKCGDTWTGQAFGYLGALSGSGPGSIGQICTGPILFSFYDNSGANAGIRPIIEINSSVQPGIANVNAGLVQNFAVIGLNFYCYTQDPNNVAYSYAEAMAGSLCLQFERNSSWLLFEDNIFNYGGSVIENGDGVTENWMGTVIFRRNILTNAYSINGSHMSAIYCDGITTPIFEDNVFDTNGWCPTLCTPATVTVTSGSPGTITWPTTPMFGNGANVYVGSNIGGLTTGTEYQVANLSGATFNLENGGTTVNISASGSVQMQWGDPAATVFNHNLYSQTTNGAMTFTGNLSSNDAANSNLLNGGIITGNLFMQCPIAAGIGCGSGEPLIRTVTSSTVSGNVVLNSCDISQAPFFNTSQQQPRGQGFTFQNCQGAIIVSNNIMSHAIGPSTVNQFAIELDNECSGVTGSGNIAYVWYKKISDSGSGDDIAITFDQTGTNVEGYPAPNRSLASYDSDVLGGPGTYAHLLAQLVARPLQTMPSDLMVSSMVEYIQAGF